MGSIDDIMQLCRLCLVKDQVNIPIFDETSDIRQTFLKINSCLPVKVSRDDNLPKKICDGCSYKLDMLYIFRNTSVDSEKQLLSWLNEAGLTSLSQAVKDGAKPEVMVKQETFETNDARIEENPEMGADAHGEISLEAQHPDMGVGAHSYIMQQQKLPYQQDFSFGEPSGSTAGLISEEPSPKRIKRAASVKKHVPLETEEEEEEELEAALQVTKAEEEDSDDVDQPDYIEAPSTSADDQPGPSGVGKGTIEAPSILRLPKIEVEESEYDRKMKKPRRTSLPRNAKAGCLNGFEKYSCPYCYEIFKSVTLYRDHCLVVHCKVMHFDDEYTCTLCSKTFKHRSNLRTHMHVHDGKDHKCTFCDRVFSTRHSLVNHYRCRHREEYVTLKLTCAICGQVFEKDERDKFYEHRQEHYMGKVACDICHKMLSFKFLKSHKLRQHNVSYIPPDHACNLCEKVFKSNHGLRSHIKTFHENKFYLCDVCGKSMASATSLKHHMCIHTGEKPFACDRCGKKFSKADFLKTHLRVHTKEKPHVCKICSKRYTQRTSLRLHIRAAHSKERPYACHICPRRFIARTLLNAHLKCHVKKSL